MATLVFADGHRLAVTADQIEILELVTTAQRGGAADVPAGWIELTDAQDGTPVQVQVALLAYLRA